MLDSDDGAGGPIEINDATLGGKKEGTPGRGSEE